MILEVAILHLKPGLSAEFEKDFVEAGQYISATPGYVSHSLSKCFEAADKYLLLVNWEKITDHTVGFRTSAQYQSWKNLLHPYYDPFPVVEHYTAVIENRL